MRYLIVSLLAALLGSGCAQQSFLTHPLLGSKPPERVSGTVAHAQPEALPADARIQVLLEEIGPGEQPPKVVAERSFEPRGAAPHPFELRFNPARIDAGRRYALRARITDAGGRLLWTSAVPHWVLTHGYPDRADLQVQRPTGDDPVLRLDAERVPRARYFECEGMGFLVRTGAGEAGVFLPDGQFLLPQVPAVSGAKYSEGDMTLWSRGEEADLERRGRRYAGCRNNPARAPWEDARVRGVDFRAVGGGPAWSLEIKEGRAMRFEFRGGEAPVITGAPQPVVAEHKSSRMYDVHTGRHNLIVLVEDRICRDPASGEVFDAAVTVSLDTLLVVEGCGRTVQPGARAVGCAACEADEEEFAARP